MNTFLLVGNKFIPEVHLRQPGFTYSCGGPFTKYKERLQKHEETGYSRYIHRNELDKVCFQHKKAYENYEDLTFFRGSSFNKALHYKAFNIAKTLKYDVCQRGLASIVFKFFDKNSTTLTGTRINSNSDSEYQQLGK